MVCGQSRKRADEAGALAGAFMDDVVQVHGRGSERDVDAVTVFAFRAAPVPALAHFQMSSDHFDGGPSLHLAPGALRRLASLASIEIHAHRPPVTVPAATHADKIGVGCASDQVCNLTKGACKGMRVVGLPG